MRVFAQPDPFVLEDELLRRVGTAQQENPLAPVLLIVPTGRLASHIRRRLAERFGACLGVEVLTHAGVARRILESSPGPCPSPASPRLLAALLGSVLRQRPGNIWSRFVQRRPGALRPLLGTLNDLREAGLSEDLVAETLREDPRERDLADVYRGYCADLERRSGTGVCDRAGLILAAVPGAARFGHRQAAILHHGAYDLIGVHLDLLHALDVEGALLFLLPAAPGARCTRFAESFARRHLLAANQELEPLGEARPSGARECLLGDRLRALYDESAQPLPPAAGRIVFRHAQGAAAEVTAALRSALSAVAAGRRPEEVLIVARTLEPYAAAFEATSQTESLPLSSSLTSPLRREPIAQDLLRGLRVVADGFPRARTAEWLASPRLRWEGLLPGQPPPRGDLADAWSREAGLLGGLEEWTEELPAWAARISPPADTGEVSRLGHALSALHERVRPESSRRWAQHAASVEALLRDLLLGTVDVDPAGTPPPATALLGLLAEMREMETRLGDARAIPFRDMVAWLEAAVRGEEPPAPDDGGGLCVLDAMQARGLTFSRVLLLGMHSGLFPRSPREDPFLGDAARERLRRGSGRPLSVSSEAVEEERLLLTVLLGSASEAIEISWQRADEGGRATAPSSALRELGRVGLGEASLAAVEAAARRLPSHPLEFLRELESDPGLLTPSEEAIQTALLAGAGRHAAEALTSRFPELGPGLEMLRAIESFAFIDGRWDGRVGGRSRLRPPYSVTLLESVGRCPLQAFCARALRITDAGREASATELAADEVGIRVHRLLESLYSRLLAEGLLRPDRIDEALMRAETLFPEAWSETLGDLIARRARRLPVLWEVEMAAWRQSLLEGIRADLRRLAAQGSTVVALEESRSADLDFGHGVTGRVRGRFDRRSEAGPLTIITDYKTTLHSRAGRLAHRTGITSMLKGRELQAPLYARLAGEAARVEVLGVGPGYGAVEGNSDRLAVFDGFENEEQRRGFDETLRVLLSLLSSGRFPIRPGDHCSWCLYAPACRRNHPPTVEREENAPDSRDYRDLSAKSKTRAPTLERVRASVAPACGEEEGEE